MASGKPLRLAPLLILGLLFSAGQPASLTAQSQSPTQVGKPNIAVWDFSLQGIGENEGRAIINRLRSELVNTFLFTVMSRDQIIKLLGEMELGQTLGDPNEAIQGGKLKGVKYVVTGSLVAVMDAIQITVEMIDGETAEIVKSITPRAYRGDLIDFLDTEVPFLAHELAGTEQQRAAQERVPFAEIEEQKSTWPLYLGILLLVAGVVVLNDAHDLDDQAEEKANQSRLSLDQQLFNEAEDDRDRAETRQILGFGLGLFGGGLLLNYFGIGAEPIETAGRNASPGIMQPSFHLEIGPQSVTAGYSYRW